MNRFFDLLGEAPEIPGKGAGSIDCSRPSRLLSKQAADSHLRLWRPGDRIASRGTRILIGIATWSGYDLRLLDVIDAALQESQGAQPLVEIFDTADVVNKSEFEKYIPGLEWFQTPVVGVWRDGQLTERKYGYDACDYIARSFDSTADEVVEFVRDRNAARIQ